MKNDFDRFFLAANSFEGFVSYFGNSYNAENGYRVYIIKGGPGTGKSSFMKYLAIKAMDKGYKVHLCHCSSDPDSLDGIIIDSLKVVVLDGTPPHTVEPKYPGACEVLIDLGAFWNSEKLAKNRMDIINATNINKAFHKTASRYLKVCGEIAEDSFIKASSYTKKEKILSFSKNIAQKNIPQKSKITGNETKRFLTGITPKGIMSFPKTVTDNYKNIIVLEDKTGAFSTLVTEYIGKYALDSGYDVIALKSPFLPSVITDHILIPELSFAVVTENEYNKFDYEANRIHQRRFIEVEAKNRQKTGFLFNEKVKKKLLFAAIEALNKAKLSHDVLEKYYIDSMNFPLMEEYTKDFCDKFFQ